MTNENEDNGEIDSDLFDVEREVSEVDFGICSDEAEAAKEGASTLTGPSKPTAIMTIKVKNNLEVEHLRWVVTWAKTNWNAKVSASRLFVGAPANSFIAFKINLENFKFRPGGWLTDWLPASSCGVKFFKAREGSDQFTAEELAWAEPDFSIRLDTEINVK